MEANLILATKELPKHLDTNSDKGIEVYVTSSNEVVERKDMEEKQTKKKGQKNQKLNMLTKNSHIHLKLWKNKLETQIWLPLSLQ